MLTEPSDLPSADRQPCPQCGSLQRAFQQSIEGATPIHAALQAKGKRGGRGKPFIELFSGDQISAATGRWKRKLRVIDRERDHYQEEVRDAETGVVEHAQEEPLSQHWGHGSAKPKKPQS